MSQRIIGITGGIASGKSTVASYLEQQYHLPIFDADLYAKAALSGNILAEVFGRYQAQVLTNHQLREDRAEGKELADLDRSKLGQIIFSDRHERQWLENLIHPVVYQRLISAIKHNATDPTLVLVIPLLFEVNWQDLITETWLVYCPPQQQIERLVARNNLTVTDAQLRIDSQMPIEQKLKLADLVIDNSFDLGSNNSVKDLSSLYIQVDRAIQSA